MTVWRTSFCRSSWWLVHTRHCRQCESSVWNCSRRPRWDICADVQHLHRLRHSDWRKSACSCTFCISSLRWICCLGSVAFFSERELLSPVHLSSVCNIRAPYSGGSNFWQYFYSIRYLGHHRLTSTENFTEIVPVEPLRHGELNTRGVAKYSDFGPIDGYISETVQDRRWVSINH